jgi:NAD(P)-dependent dehydrogenase (short-subunit alcohol dehydrogenase family)
MPPSAIRRSVARSFARCCVCVTPRTLWQDICVANAGIGRVGSVQSMTEDEFSVVMGEWADLLRDTRCLLFARPSSWAHQQCSRLADGRGGFADVNVKGTWLTVKACSREMIRINKGGRIAVISSANAVIASRGA